MGAGNWRGGDGERFVYVRYAPYEPEESEDDEFEPLSPEDASYFEWEDMKANASWIPALRRDSFKRYEKYLDTFGREYEGDIIAANELCVVRLFDWQGIYAVLCITPREDAPAFASAYVERISTGVFDAMADMYELSIRDTAWTSRPYRKKEKTA